MKTIKIHVTPGVDAREAARDFLKTGAVGIDDIGENLYDLVREEILDELGNVGDGIDLQTDRVESPLGPVFVLRNADLWSAAEAKKAEAAKKGWPRSSRRDAPVTSRQAFVLIKVLVRPRVLATRFYRARSFRKRARSTGSSERNSRYAPVAGCSKPNR